MPKAFCHAVRGGCSVDAGSVFPARIHGRAAAHGRGRDRCAEPFAVAFPHAITDARAYPYTGSFPHAVTHARARSRDADHR